MKSDKKTFAVSFQQFTCEASRVFAYFGNFTCGFYVFDCAIEGISNEVLVANGYVMGFSFLNNYFEQNATSERCICWFDLSGLHELRSLSIVDNLFAGIILKIGNEGKPIIIVPHNNLRQGVLVVERNALNDPSQLKTSLFDNFSSSSNYIKSRYKEFN